MGRKNITRTRPQTSKRTRVVIGLSTPWHEAGIETLEAYSRVNQRDREGWR